MNFIKNDDNFISVKLSIPAKRIKDYNSVY